MKLAAFLLIVSFHVSATGVSQITLSEKNAPLEKVFNAIEKQSGYVFFYDYAWLDEAKTVSIKVKNAPLADVLNVCFEGQPLTYSIIGKTVVVKQKEPIKAVSPVLPPPPPPRIITGTVTDEKGAPLAGVSISIKGTSFGTTTNEKGFFRLELAQDNDVLLISYVGYAEQEVVVGSQANININLQPLSKGIDEIVVVGYGTQKKRDLTGSVATIDQETIKDLSVASIDQKMIGQVAGVQIQQVSGAPGAGTSVKIRGSGSLGAGNEPLYVIDGMPYSSGLNQNINPLTFINPNDIETITILKDASSTAIYGSRGANGVVMITTKNANNGSNQITYSGYAGVMSIPQKGRPKMLNAKEFAEYQRDRIDYSVRQKEGREPVSSDYPVEYQNLDKLGEGTNWYNLILRNSLVQDHTISIQKGTAGSKIYLSFGFYDQQGTIKYTNLKRFSADFNYNLKINKNLNFNASLKPTFIDQNRTLTGTGRDADVTGISLWANPTVSPYDNEGNLIPFLKTPVSKYNTTWSFPNPLYILQESKRNYKELRNLGSAFIEWQPVKNLKVRTALSTIFSVSKYDQYIPSTIGRNNNPPISGNGSANVSDANSFDWLIENTVSYSKAFNKHNLNGLVGYTTEKATSNGINLNAAPYSNDLIQTINAAQGITSWGQSVNAWSMISYLGRLNYSYDNKYLFTATLRSDGSSRFGENDRFALFPSVALAWIISDENFIKKISWIDQLKIRTSYGKSGNNNIGNYSHLSNVSLGQYTFNNNTVSSASVSLYNPDLGWEESEQVDIGLETSVFKGRLGFTADFYRRKSVNMLLNDIIPAITGFNNQLVNKGGVENKGIELGINALPISGKINWNVNFNIAFNKNKVLATNESKDAILSGSMDGRPTNISIIGKSIGRFYGFILEGVYSQADIDNPSIPKYNGAQAGYPQYKDLNGDGIVSEILDYTDLGNPYPDFIFGFSNRLAYKNFDFSINLNGQHGGYIMNGMRQTTDNLQGFFNLGKEWVNRWRSDEDPGDGIHAFGPNGVHRVNDKLWLEDASYLRITNLTFGYTFLKLSSLKATPFNNLRLYLSIQNLATFTSYTGANPEGQALNIDNTLAPGYDMSTYPIARSITAGINVQF